MQSKEGIMSDYHIERARILTEALPYIQKYANKTVVVKYGGNAMTSEELKTAVIHDIVLLSLVGVHVVVVHGGGPEINTMLTRVGKESKFVNGLRYTCLLYTSRNQIWLRLKKQCLPIPAGWIHRLLFRG